MDWPGLPELVAELVAGERDVVQTTKDCIAAIKKAEDFNAVIEINPQAIQRAKRVGAQVKKGKLHGVPFLAKDNFLTSHTHTTAASNILKPFKAPYQATAIERLEAEGAILLGKTNLDAFAHGSSTENSDFGPTKNPHNNKMVPGGSSGGSAAAVQMGLAPFALGTDTGGSIRQPASFCGVVGLKPTYGLISRFGVIAMASSTDVIGPLSRSVSDAAYLLDILAGPDSQDSTTIKRSNSYTARPAKQTRLGVVKEHFMSGVSNAVKDETTRVIEELKSAGHQVTEVSIPVDELALAAYYVIVPAEISSNLARYDGIKYGHSTVKPTAELPEFYEQTRAEGFNAENRRRIITGTFVLSSGYYDAYYKQAQTVRTKLVEQYQNALKGVDVLVGPTAPTTAFKIGAKPQPLEMYMNDSLTVGASLVGIPAINVPIGMADGMPVGLQLMAAQNKENMLFSVAAAVEEFAK